MISVYGSVGEPDTTPRKSVYRDKIVIGCATRAIVSEHRPRSQRSAAGTPDSSRTPSRLHHQFVARLASSLSAADAQTIGLHALATGLLISTQSVPSEIG